MLIFGLNKKNIDGYCISIWNAWRMGMACHWTFSGCLFRSKKIPEIARGLGKGIREFKDATKDIKQEIEQGAQPDEKKP